MSDCLFCKIIGGDIPSEKVFENDEMIAIADINPQAPVHLLVIPKQHIATTNDTTADHDGLLGRMLLTGSQLAADQGVAEDGYRLLFNCNQHGGQTVYHIHLHVMGGRQLLGLG